MKSAHATPCKNHLPKMGVGLNMYVDDNGNRYPR
jgi:hypothetical protein